MMGHDSPEKWWEDGIAMTDKDDKQPTKKNVAT